MSKDGHINLIIWIQKEVELLHAYFDIMANVYFAEIV